MSDCADLKRLQHFERCAQAAWLLEGSGWMSDPYEQKLVRDFDRAFDVVEHHKQTCETCKGT